jgi:uncharacterized protein YqjF (DUF2071 family)
MAGTFLTAEWRSLVMLNFEVEPDVLLPRVPKGTQLDLFRGRALVSVVGFRFLKTRVLGASIPGYADFDEVNLRFYVRSASDEAHRGVVFVKEIVPHRAIAWTARALYNENYFAHPMRSEVSAIGEDSRYRYAFDAHGRAHSLRATTHGPAHALVSDSEEEFIAEHYYGYATQRDGGTLEYRVEHPPWQVWTARDAELELDASLVYGDAFVASLAASPCSALIAVGSPISVAKPVRVA